jgi:uncharacterized protein (TIGR03435 family)
MASRFLTFLDVQFGAGKSYPYKRDSNDKETKVMRRRLWTILGLMVMGTAAQAQDFEVASIRVNKADNSGVEGKRIDIHASPTSLTMRNVTLLSAIRWAYNLHDFQISGGPEWRGSERYDILARTASASSEDQQRLMLRKLLSDRFKLSVRQETKELPVYILAVGKNGHRMQRSKTDGPRTVRPSNGGLAFQNATMADLESFLSGIPAVDRPVLDRTGLEGAYDFLLLLFDAPSDGDLGALKGAMASAGAPAYADALQRIGLRLDGVKQPVEMLTIERAEKPSEN